MLAPRERRLLLDALRPPPGHRLDRAVGTSFSLDLLALLTAPLAFTFFDWEDDEGAPTADPLALLEAVRRHADRITLFCQAGRIAVPRPGQILLGYLEGSVVEAAAPAPEGAFHPKLWVLRFTGDVGPVRYRVLCLSRNLTFDRSWDTALVLDGELAERTRAFAANRPLGDFLVALPDLAVRPLEERRREDVSRMADEIRRVRFELPEDVENLTFWPLGIAGHRRFPIAESDRRLMIVSPFVSAPLLDKLSRGRAPGILVSRPECLEALPRKTLAGFAEVLVLSPGADVQGPEDEADAAKNLEEAGLHAKLFVLDDGWDARVWTGSANATTAAFGQNVELLVELVGKKSRLGIDAFLSDGDPTGSGMRALLQPFRPAGEEPQPASLDEELRRRVDALRREIASWKLSVRVEARSATSEFALVIEPGGQGWPAPPEDVDVRFWPTTLPAARALPVAPGGAEPLRFDPVSFEAITGFVGAEVTLRGPEPISASFVLNLPLLGAPSDRRERLLRALLKDRAQVLRLLYLLLSDGPISVQALIDATKSGEKRDPYRRAGLADAFPLLEVMLAALARDRGRLDDVAKLIEDLRRTSEGRALLPEGLESIWDPIWSARQEGRT